MPKYWVTTDDRGDIHLRVEFQDTTFSAAEVKVLITQLKQSIIDARNQRMGWLQREAAKLADRIATLQDEHNEVLKELRKLNHDGPP